MLYFCFWIVMAHTNVSGHVSDSFCLTFLIQFSCSSLVVQNFSCVNFSCFPCVILHAKQNEHDRNIQEPLRLMTCFHSTGCDATGRQWIHTLLLIPNWNRSASHSWMEASILSRLRRHWCSKESVEDLRWAYHVIQWLLEYWPHLCRHHTQGTCVHVDTLYVPSWGLNIFEYTTRWTSEGLFCQHQGPLYSHLFEPLWQDVTYSGSFHMVMLQGQDGIKSKKDDIVGCIS